MPRWLIDLIAGCRHRSLTRVFSDKTTSWVVCLDCGARLSYDMEKMRVVPGIRLADKEQTAECRR